MSERTPVDEHVLMLEAALSIQRHLALALFDALDPEQQKVVMYQFADVTEKTNVHTLYSEMPETFLDAFVLNRDVILETLRDATASPTLPPDAG